MLGNICFITPVLLSLIYSIFFFMRQNIEIIVPNQHNMYEFSIKKAKHQTSSNLFSLVIGYIVLLLLISFIFFPLYFVNTTYLMIGYLQYKLSILGLLTYIIFLKLLSLTKKNYFYQNEFLLSLWLFLPYIYLIFLFSTNLLMLYISLEIFSVWTLIILYTTHHSMTKKKKKSFFSNQYYTFLIYQFILNFVSSYIYCLFLVFILCKYGVLNFSSFINLSTFMAPSHTDNYFNNLALTSIVLFLFLKFGLGPWFQYKLQIYNLLTFELLLFYLYFYGIIILPYGINIIMYLFTNVSLIYSIFIVFFLITFFWLLVNVFKFISLNQILGGSSIIFYFFIFTQLFFLL